MPRVTHVEHARKPMPEHGIKVGDSYYWWKFRFGGKHVSKTMPRQSQLTQSEYLGTMYGIQESLEDACSALREGDVADKDFQQLVDALDSAISDVENQRDECQSKRDNMPEQLQDAPSGEMLGNRVDSCENIQSELDSAKSAVEDKSGEYDELKTQLEELQKELEELTDDDEKTAKQKEIDEKEEEISSLAEDACTEVEGVSWDLE